MNVAMPDGTTITNVPEGTTKKELMQRYAASKKPKTLDPSEYDPSSAEFKAKYGPTGSNAENALAGAGKFFVDTGRGLKQRMGMLGMDDIAKYRKLDEPLMDTKAGMAGNIGAGIASTLPALAIPGVNTVAGAGLFGMGMAETQPFASEAERATNLALGGVAGAGGQKLGQMAGSKIAKNIAGKESARAAAKADQAVKSATLNSAQKAGYVVPPSSARPSVTNRVVESIAGKAQTQQQAAVKNQAVTNKLARLELGMDEGDPITKEALRVIRQNAGKVYEEVKNIGTVSVGDSYKTKIAQLSRTADDIIESFPDAADASTKKIHKLQESLQRDEFNAKGAVEFVKKLRSDGRKNMQAFDNPAKNALGRAQREAASILEEEIEAAIKQSGNADLMQRFNEARTLIAKTHTVESALNEGTGNVMAKRLASDMGKDKALSGNLKEIAKFSAAFPKAAAEQLSSPGVSALDTITAVMGGSAVNPALYGLPAARIGARAGILSKPYQRMATGPLLPSAPGAFDRIMAPEIANKIIPAAGISLPAYINE